jgi:Fe-S-cluster containining protein
VSKKEKKVAEEPFRRLRFPDDEEKLPWLSALLESYAIIDRGVSFAIDREREKRSRKLACRRGCDKCCQTHKDIPVYPLELVGMYWFSSEKMERQLREILKERLSSHREGDACPFLIAGSCSVHPVRPVACRQFNVFGEPCGEGEDPYYTRRDDVLTPIQGYTNKAFWVMLPFYGTAEGEDETKAVSRIIRTQVVNLQTYDWKKLVKVMENLDAKYRKSAETIS